MWRYRQFWVLRCLSPWLGGSHVFYNLHMVSSLFMSVPWFLFLSLKTISWFLVCCFVWVCMLGVHVHHRMYVEVWRQLLKVYSFFTPFGLQGSNWYHQTCSVIHWAISGVVPLSDKAINSSGSGSIPIALFFIKSSAKYLSLNKQSNCDYWELSWKLRIQTMKDQVLLGRNVLNSLFRSRLPSLIVQNILWFKPQTTNWW